MGKSAAVNVRVNSQVKSEAERVLAKLGLSMSTAIDVFLRQVALTGSIPFSISLPGFADGDDGKDEADSQNDLSREDVLFSIERVSSKFSAIEQAYLFGSFARGAQSRESDIDVRLIIKDDVVFTLRDAAQFAKQLEQETGRAVDVVTARVLKNESLAEAIRREKVLAYEC